MILRRHITSFLTTLLFVLATPAFAADRPNIIFILTDDMGVGDLGCYGGKLVPTPNIDQLAREGTRYRQYYSAAPICSPSRAGLMTGMYPGRWRITSFLQTRAGNKGCEQADFLDPAAPSLPRQLKESGYSTAHVGKWHLGGGRDVVDPPKFAAYGYDEHAGTYESPEPHPDITATNWIWSDKDKVKRWDRTAFFVDKTLDFVKRNKAAGKPAFVNLWLDDPHTPWVPREGAPRNDSQPNLKGVLTELDRQIGRLMVGLKEIGADDDTLVIFTSDNGALPTFRGNRSAPYRGSKLALYEGGIRMPLIIRWPGQVPAGRTDEGSVLSGLDFFPTLCALVGAKVPAGAQLDGFDVSAALKGQVFERQQPIFWEYGRNDQFFKFPANDRSPNVAMRKGNWKLLINADGAGAQLYDVTTDLGESSDVAGQNAELVKTMSGEALRWRRSLP